MGQIKDMWRFKQGEKDAGTGGTALNVVGTVAKRASAQYHVLPGRGSNGWAERLMVACDAADKAPLTRTFRYRIGRVREWAERNRDSFLVMKKSPSKSALTYLFQHNYFVPGPWKGAETWVGGERVDTPYDWGFFYYGGMWMVWRSAYEPDPQEMRSFARLRDGLMWLNGDEHDGTVWENLAEFLERAGIAEI